MGSHICPDCGGQVVAVPGAFHDCPVRRREREEAAIAKVREHVLAIGEVVDAAREWGSKTRISEPIRTPQERRLYEALDRLATVEGGGA